VCVGVPALLIHSWLAVRMRVSGLRREREGITKSVFVFQNGICQLNSIHSFNNSSIYIAVLLFMLEKSSSAQVSWLLV